jgi:hypothetical protein
MNALINDTAAEHILLESELPQEEPAESARTVRLQMRLRHRISRSTVDLTLYEEGYLRVREEQGRRRRTESLVDLSHLDARPTLSRYAAGAPLRVALGCVALASLAGTLVAVSIYSMVALPVALVSLIFAGIAGLVYLSRTHERVVFVTRRGRAPAITLIGGFGCFGRCRALVPQLVRAINDARRNSRDGIQSELRREIREHYRLREGGAITSEECVAAVQRILARFS